MSLCIFNLPLTAALPPVTINRKTAQPCSTNKCALRHVSSHTDANEVLRFFPLWATPSCLDHFYILQRNINDRTRKSHHGIWCPPWTSIFVYISINDNKRDLIYICACLCVCVCDNRRGGEIPLYWWVPTTRIFPNALGCSKCYQFWEKHSTQAHRQKFTKKKKKTKFFIYNKEKKFKHYGN